MGWVPSHSSSCVPVRSFLLKCRYCGNPVVYFECSCGSKVFLDPPREGNHRCAGFSENSYIGEGGRYTGRGGRAKILLDLIQYAEYSNDETVRCVMCDVDIKRLKLKKHLKKCPKREEFMGD